MKTSFKISTSIFTNTLFVALLASSAKAADQSANLVDLGSPNSVGYGASLLVEENCLQAWNNKIWIQGAANNNQALKCSTWNPASNTWVPEYGVDAGNYATFDEESMNAAHVFKGDLFFECEDGYPNAVSGPWWNNGTGWQQVPVETIVSRDCVHTVGQYLWQGKLFCATRAWSGTAQTDTGIMVSTDGGATFSAVGDPLNAYSSNWGANHISFNYFCSFGGGLYANAYYMTPVAGGGVGTTSYNISTRYFLSHYTGAIR